MAPKEAGEETDPSSVSAYTGKVTKWTTSSLAWLGSWVAYFRKEGVEKAADKLPDGLLEKAQKPETGAMASEIGNLTKAVADGNITGMIKSTASLTLNHIKPGLTEDRRVAGSVAGATLGGKLCGPQCAVIGALAGGLYGHLKPKDKVSGEKDDAENTDDD